MAKQDERRIALEIMKKVRKLDLPLKLDEITEGRGNCFPLSVLAQCRRLEIFRQLDIQIQNIIKTGNPTLLRQAVYNFIYKSNNKKILNYKKKYEEILAPLDGRSWKEYWETMIRNYEWVDYIFIQSTAWFLGHDIIIVTTTSTEQNPFITISGNLVDENMPCQGIELTIGSLSQVHYQSLLPITFRVHQNQVKAGFPEDTIELKASSINASRSIHNDVSIEVPGNIDRQEHILQATNTLKTPATLKQNQADLNSLTEFPDLNPTKKKLQSSQSPSVSQKVKQRGVREQKESKVNVTKTERKRNNKVGHTQDMSNLQRSNANSPTCPRNENPQRPREMENKQFQYKLENEVLTFKFISDKRVICPKCGNNFKNLLNHVQKSKCKISQFEDLSLKFKQFISNNMTEEIKANQRKWKQESRYRQREQNPQKVKDNQNRWRKKSDANQREKDQAY